MPKITLASILVALATLSLGACSSPTGPSLGKVKVTAEGMAITIQTTEPITISKLVVSLKEGGFVTGLDRSDEHGRTVAPLVATGKFDLASTQISVPAGTSAIRLYAVLGSGDVGFATNPAHDWVVRDGSGRAVKLSDEELQLHLSSKVDIRVNGTDEHTTHIAKGECVTLSWTSQDVTKCSTYFNWLGGVRGDKPPYGSEVVCPSDQADYGLHCRGLDGSVADSATVLPK